MPIVPSVQKQMTLSGDYGMDKYISYKIGSLTVATTATSTGTHSHGLGAIPLVYTQWSTTSDFSVPREVLQNPSDLYPTGEPYILRTWADATNVYFYFQNFSGSTQTIYYRIWSLPTSDWANSVDFTSTISGLSAFTMNGEQNYLKPYLVNKITVSSAPQSVTHSLGYLPTTMVWQEDQSAFGAGTIAPIFQPVIFIDPAFSGSGIPVAPGITTTQLTFNANGTYHYRIYLEDIYA